MTFVEILAPFLTAMAVTLAAGPVLLPRLRRLRWGQEIRAQGPVSHLGKAGTSTMGGLMFITGTVAASLLFSPLDPALTVVLLVFLSFAALGFADDYFKVALRRPLGLKARYKLAGQLLIAGGLAWLAAGLGTWVAIPFTDLTLDLGLLYPPFAVLVVVSTVNAANLTDGLDGLLAGATVFSGMAYTFISAAAGRPDLAVFAAALSGACLGFLRHNRHPARVFMGDTGSLAIGGGLAALALLTKSELVLVLVGGLLVAETLSVIIQVFFFRLFRRRIFLMSPLHHHFELAGWSETKVVERFWLAAAVFAFLGMVAF